MKNFSVIDQTINGVLSVDDPLHPTLKENFIDEYQLVDFVVDQPAIISISSTDFLAYLEVVDADTGEFVRSGGESNPLSFTPQENVKYILRVTSRYSSEVGQYTLTSQLPPDLEILSAEVPAVIQWGDTVDISWTVANQAEASTSVSSWYDQLYLSQDTELDDSDIYLDGAQINNLLASGESYTQSQSITFKNIAYSGESPYDAGLDFTRSWYLLIKSDAYENQPELNEDNNLLSIPLTFSLADLLITNATAPTFGNHNQEFSVSWTVENQGNGTAFGISDYYSWADQIYLSEDSVLDAGDRLLGSISANVDFLEPGDGYTNEVSVTSTSGQGGSFLIFVTNGASEQSELDNSNNTFAVPFSLPSIPSDLVVSKFVAPSSASWDQNVQFSWTVENQGTNATTQSAWIDRLYISRDNVLDEYDRVVSDEYLNIDEGLPLDPGESYSKTGSFKVYENIGFGDFYLILKTDYYNSQFESNEENNVISQPFSIGVPNLIVADRKSPEAVQLGDTISVSWTVQNIGEAAAGADWYDQVYISYDGTSRNIRLANRWTGPFTPLEPGETYEITQEVIIPDDIPSGNRYLLFVADGRREQGETDESDNELSIPIELIGDAPNLTFSSVTAPTSANWGETIDVSWTVVNQGTVEAASEWFDRVYLSEDSVFDPTTDTFLVSHSVENLQPLGSGESYTATASFEIPGKGPGDLFLLFSTDHSNDQREVDETDNFQVVPISLSAPNLAITNFNGPTVASLGETIDLKWTVLNQGNGQAPKNWIDTVYISADTFLDDGDVVVGSLSSDANIPLQSGESYLRNASFKVPITAIGDRYLLLSVDNYSNQDETDESDNVQAIPITIQSSDLVVSSLSTPEEINSGAPFELVWTLTNQGDVDASGKWRERVFLSNNDSIGDDEKLAELEFSGTIAIGETIERRQVIQTSPYVSGDHWVVLETNSGGILPEFLRANNTRITEQPIRVKLSSFPNLEVSSVTVPDTAFSGQGITVDWTVTNTGTGATLEPYWYDRVWASRDQELDATDVYLGEAINPSYLEVGDSYFNSLSVKLPQEFEESLYILVEADSRKQVDEFPNEIDNVSTAAFIDLEPTPPPDLQVTSVAAPAIGFSGQPSIISWTVTNLGENRTFASRWYDEIYLSDDELLDAGDEYLGRYYHTEYSGVPSSFSTSSTTVDFSSLFKGELDPGESYSATLELDLPEGISGDYYVFVKTDTQDDVYESAFEENNDNYDATPISIQLTPPADLVIAAVDAPKTAKGGTTLRVNYQIDNLGAPLLPGSFWNTQFYLSPDDQFDPRKDQRVGSQRFAIPFKDSGSPISASSLSAIESFDLAVDLTVPGLNGTYYLYAVVDSRDEIFELDEENNLGAAPTPITIETERIPYPNPQPDDPTYLPIFDLVVDNVVAPAEGFIGQTLDVAWTVRNNAGETSMGSWKDSLYLSRDAYFDRSSDAFLGVVGTGGHYAVGETYTKRAAFSVPNLLPGDYYLFAFTDSDGKQLELDEGNNLSVPVPIQITLPPPSDLAVTGITIPAEGIVGEPASFTYTLENQGTTTLRGEWFDAIYLSKDRQWDINDVLLGKEDFNSKLSGGLANGASMSRTVSAELPGVAPGDYYVIVRSDIRNQIPETDEANNVAVSAETIAVDMPTLELGNPVNGFLKEGQALFYRVEVGEGESLLINFDSASDDVSNEVYVSYGKPPTRSDFDYNFNEPFGADQKVVVPFTKTGTYYVMVYGDSAPTTLASTFSLEASLIDFSVFDEEYGIGGTAGKRTIQINGTKFDRSTTAQLIDETGASVAAVDYYWVDGTRFYATFDLTQVESGIYDVVVKNVEGDTVVVDDGFEVVPGGGSNVVATPNVPKVLRHPVFDRVAQQWSFYVRWGNEGINDAYAPVLEVSSTAPIALDPKDIPRFGIPQKPFSTPRGLEEVTYLAGNSLEIYGAAGGDGPPGILMPGQYNQVPVFAINDPNPATIYTRVDSLGQGQLDSLFDWESLRDQFQPFNMTDEEFSPVFEQIISEVGTTTNDYLRMLAENASLLTGDGETSFEKSDLLDLEVRQAIAALNTSISGKIFASNINVDVSGQEVTAVNFTTNELFTTTSLNDGSFIFEELTPGEYAVRFSGGVVTSEELITVAQGQALTYVALTAVLGASLEGFATHTSTGLPIANAEILISQLDDEATRLITVTTDEQGKFSVTHLATGNYRLFSRKAGLADYRSEFVVDSLIDEIEVNFSTVNAGQLTGTVFNSTDGSILTNATGSIIPIGEDEPIAGFFTDENGRFDLASLHPGKYQLQVFAADFANALIQNIVVSEGQTTQIDINLAPSASIAGKVELPDDSALPGFSVGLYAADSELVAFAVTEADGTFRFENLSAGDYTLKVLDGNLSLSSLPVTVEAGNNLAVPDISLPVLATISGTIFDQKNQGLNDARVIIYTADGQELISVDVNEAGQFRIGLFEAGTYQLTAVSEAGLYETREVTIDSNGTASEAEIEFVPGTLALSGQVISPTGTPLAEAPVVARLISDNLGSTQTLSTVTDELGNYSFEELVDGEYELVTFPEDFGFGETNVTLTGNNSSGLVLQSTERRSIQGLVTDENDNPVAQAEVIVYKAGTNEAVAFRTIDSFGKVLVDNLAPGLYDIDVISEEYVLESIESLDLSVGNAEISVELKPESTYIAGTVYDSGNNPVDSGTIFAYDVSGRPLGFTEINPDGSYEFTSLPAEIISLEFTTPGYFPVQNTLFDLEENSTQENVNLLLSNAAINISDSITLQQESTEFSALLPLATRSEDWWYDAFFREIEPERLDPPEFPKCEEHRKQYRLVAREWAEMREAFQSAEDRQLSFQQQGIDTVSNLLLRSVKLGTSMLVAIPGIGSSIKALNHALSALDLYRRYDISLDSLLKGAWDSVIKTTDAIRESDTPTAWIRTAKLAFTGADFLQGQLGLLRQIQANIIQPLFESGGEDLVLREGFPRLKKVEFAYQAKNAIGKLLEIGIIVDQYFQWLNSIELEGERLALEWYKFIQELNNYEEEWEDAKEALERYEDRNEIGELKLRDDYYTTTVNKTLSDNVLWNDSRENCEDELRIIKRPSGGEIRTAHGTLVLNSDGSFIYTPDDGFIGTDSFEYEVPSVTDENGVIIKKEFAKAYIEVVEEDDDDRCEGPNCKDTPKIGSFDPNDILGPEGYGEANWIPASQPLDYTIRFENDKDLATAPAQVVRITQQLDPDLDFRTFRVGDFGFGDIFIDVPDNRTFYQQRLDLTETYGLYLDFAAGIDIQTGEAFWQLNSVDPQTGDLPANPLLGFLPPNEDGTEGQGFVNYTIKAKNTVETGTVIDAEAEIIFDANEPIDTPPIFNTLDTAAPTSTITALPSSAGSAQFQVSWLGNDEEGGSGLAGYTVYVSDNGGGYTTWLQDTTLTESTFIGDPGHTYSFYVVATDNAGNRETIPFTAQSTTQVSDQIAILGDVVWHDLNANGIQDAGEPGLAGVTVNLYNSNETLVTTTTTDADGEYRFIDLAPADYIVEVVPPETFWISPQQLSNDTALDSDIDDATGRTGVIALAAGETNLNIDAGLFQPGAITGHVFNDLNGNGQKDSDEPGIANQQINLFYSLSIPSIGEDQTFTDADGNYSFTNLIPGKYSFYQNLGANWQQTYPIVDVSTTASNLPLYTPSEPDSVSPGSAAINAASLINLDDFRSAPRFASIDGSGFASVIIDTGVDLDHPFFGPDADGDGVSDRIVFQYDFGDDDTDASDKNGHGSHIASIIGSQDGTYTGIAPKADLIALKVFKDNGSGYFSDLEESLQWVIDNATTYNIASVNLSLGDERNWTTDIARYGIGDELAALTAQGIIATAAAGNNFARFGSLPGLAYPAADPNTIAVGAVWSATDQIADFSQRDKDLLDVFAPGISIVGANATGGTQTLSGTSQAAPHVAGIAVLAQQIASEQLGRRLSVAEFDNLLKTTGIVINDGDDEIDSVVNTGLNFPRVNMLALAESILTLDGNAPSPTVGNTNNDSTEAPLYFPGNASIGSHQVTLVAGQTVTNLDFGNQLFSQPPVLAVNAGLLLNEGTAKPITAEQLQVTDLDSAAVQLTYTLAILPTNGTLRLNGSPLGGTQTFTQADIDNGRLAYTHSGSKTTSDSFSFTVTDEIGNVIGTTDFQITINPVAYTPIRGSISGGTRRGTDGADYITGYHQSVGIALRPGFTKTFGRDIILAGAGDDIIVGGFNSDRLTGGEGRDRFVYNTLNDAADIITDFTPGTDKIVLTNLLKSVGYQGSDPIGDGYVILRSWGQSGTSSYVQIDSDGSSGLRQPHALLLAQNVNLASLNNVNNFEF